MQVRTMGPWFVSPLALQQALRLCTICGQPARSLKRGRCDACYTYWHKHGCERPPYLWGRCFTGRLPKRASAAG